MNIKVSNKGSFKDIIPLLVFVITFLGAGIYYGDFYALPSPIAAVMGIIAALILLKGNLTSKFDTFLKGCGDGKILTMCIIYLLAGAFATVSNAAGSVDAIVSLGVNYISPSYFAAGVFVMASFLSFASGTSVGSIVTLAPIVIELANRTDSPLGLIGAALLCGAMFGDNLSIISDTTIAATQSLECEMKDKFKVNFRLALPASILTIAAFLIMGYSESSTPLVAEKTSINLLLILPYILVIFLAIKGFHVFLTLFAGIIVAGVLGLINGSFSLLEFTKLSYEGFISMNEIFILSLLTGGLAAMVEKAGGINYILEKINSLISSKRSAYFGIAGVVSAANLCTANNTIAILISGKVAKEINDKYHLENKKTASVLDIFACIVQGLIPYGAQILILISLSKFNIEYLDLLLNSYYLHLLPVITIVALLLKKNNKLKLIK